MCRIRAAEDPRRGYVREKVLPGDAVAVEQVQNGSRDGAIPTEGRRGGRDDLRGREMAEGGRRERVRAIRKRRSDHRREVPIADRERLGEPVIEGQVAIVVVPHRLVSVLLSPVAICSVASFTRTKPSFGLSRSVFVGWLKFASWCEAAHPWLRSGSGQ